MLSLNVALVHVEGELLKRSSLRLALQACCAVFPDGARGHGSVADRSGGFRDFQIGDREGRELCRAAEEAGLAERAPRVTEAVDTSDRFAQVTLHVSHEKGAFPLQLNLMCSGYEGPDADALRRFFATLFRIAGVREESVLRDLT